MFSFYLPSFFHFFFLLFLALPLSALPFHPLVIPLHLPFLTPPSSMLSMISFSHHPQSNMQSSSFIISWPTTASNGNWSKTYQMLTNVSCGDVCNIIIQNTPLNLLRASGHPVILELVNKLHMVLVTFVSYMLYKSVPLDMSQMCLLDTPTIPQTTHMRGKQISNATAQV